jgi:predicted esterase
MATRLRRLLLTMCAAVALPTGAMAADGDAAGPIALRRADLAAAYLRFDHLFARTPVAGEALAAVNERFDDLTGLFFRGDARGAILALADLSADLNGGDDEDRLFASVVVDVGSRVLDPCADDELAVTLRALVPADGAPPATVTLRTRAGERIASVPVEIGAGAVRVSLPLEGLPEGGADYDLTLERDGAPPMLLARLAGVCGSLDAQRAHNERLLGAIESAPAIAQALAAARSRNDLLTDSPPSGESTTLVAGLGSIAASMAGEIDALQRGRNPYAHRAGHAWRTVRLGETDIPVRIYAPEKAALGGAPLVIALHGAGGDENLFPDGYGAGLITRLADERGFIVASPRTEFFLANPAAFETLIAVMRGDYDIDPARVYAIGHSLGSVAITSSGPEIVDVLAAAACLAGPVFIAPPSNAPALLLIAAELDPIAPPSRLARYVDAGRRAGVAVEYRELAGQGHTLMVNEALPLAIDWLLQRRLEAVHAAP